MARDAQCPKCNAALPRRGQFCIECGLDLYAEGLRKAPSPWPLILVAIGIVAAVVAYLAFKPATPKDAPEIREVRALTRHLLDLAAEKDYDRIVSTYYAHDPESFGATGKALSDISSGRGQDGLRTFGSLCKDNPQEAENLMRKYGSQHAEYVLGLLEALTFKKGPFRTFAGGTTFGSERTSVFLGWYLKLAFEDVDTKGAEITDLGWQKSPDGKEDLLVATVRYATPPKPIPGVADPTLLPWRQLGSGRYALDFGNRDHHLDEVLDFLQRLRL